MTIPDYLTYFSMPIAGLVIGGIVPWLNRRDTAKFDSELR